MRLVVFTVCPNHRVAEAAVLFNSLHRHLPDADLVLVVADRLHPGVPYPTGCEVMAAEALGILDFAGFAFRYDVREFSAALKPFVFRHLLERPGYTHCLYFDPDTELFGTLPAVQEALAADASFILTPHILAPAERDDGPNDVTIMRGGVYNLGFLGVSGTPEALELLAWWSRWARWHCVDDQPTGLFVDQKFMDLVPGFAPSARILRDPGLNVAYWNLGQRRFEPDAPEGPEVDGAPLGFFHFSGFDPADCDQLSSRTSWFRDADLPPAWRDFLAGYADRLRAAGHGRVPPGCYAYGRFASGVPIPAIVRRMFRDDHPAWAGNPFETFEAWAHLPATGGVVTEGHAVPSLIMQWLQVHTPEFAGFEVTEPAGSGRVTQWWLRHGTAVADRRFLEPQATAAGLRPVHPGANYPGPSPARVDVTVIAPFDADEPAAHAGDAQLTVLSLAGETSERFDLATGSAGSRQASGRLLCFTLACDQLAQAIAAPGLPRPAYRVFVPAAEEVPLSAASLAALGRVDEIWAPTRFIQARLVLAAGLPVLHMPVAWSFPQATSSANAAPMAPGRPYIFAEADGFAGHGDLLAAIKAFQAAFPAHAAHVRPALVILCDRLATADPALRAAVASDPAVIVREQTCDETSRAALVAGATCVLMLHRGQALGLPVARAMACGVPVVATAYGGCTDLLTPGTGFPVEYRVVQPTAEGEQGRAEADVRHAAWSLREIFDCPELARERAGNALTMLDTVHAPRSVATRLAARLQHLNRVPTSAAAS